MDISVLKYGLEMAYNTRKSVPQHAIEIGA